MGEMGTGSQGDERLFVETNRQKKLQSNVASLFEVRIMHTLSLGEHVAMHEAMSSALSVLIDGDVNRWRAVLESQLLASQLGAFISLDLT